MTDGCGKTKLTWWMGLLLLALTVVVVALDQASKEWIRTNLPLGGSLPSWGCLTIVHVQNTGAAFGLFTDQAFLLSALAIAGLIVVLLFFRHISQLGLAGAIALCLVFAGAAGNLTDRLRIGHVTDFIYIRLWQDVYWPAFNVADSAISVGAILLSVAALVAMGKKKDEQRTQAGNTPV